MRNLGAEVQSTIIRTVLNRDGSVWFVVVRNADGTHIVRFPEVADFVIRYEHSFPQCDIAPVSMEMAEAAQTLYHQQIVPMLRTAAGALVLHGAFVAESGVGCMLAGVSGAGKSSLALALSRKAMTLVSDDSVDVAWDVESGCYRAAAVSQSVRLWPDSYAALRAAAGALATGVHLDAFGKYSLRLADETSSVPAPTLAAIYFLQMSGLATAPVIKPLPPARAFRLLLNGTFILDTTEAALNARMFRDLTALVQRVPLFSLDYPRDYSSLDDVCTALIASQRALIECKT